MIIDAHATFLNGATGFGSGTGGVGPDTGRRLVGDVYDTQVARDVGRGQPLYLVCSVSDTFYSADDDTTLQIALVSDAEEEIATDGSASLHYVSPVFALSELTAGATLFVVALPAEGRSFERYLGILADVAEAQLIGGALYAFLTLDPALWTAHEAPGMLA